MSIVGKKQVQLKEAGTKEAVNKRSVLEGLNPNSLLSSPWPSSQRLKVDKLSLYTKLKEQV